MTPQQVIFSQSRDRLIQAVTACGFPAELGELCARQIGSPKGIDRLTSYVWNVRPKSEELLVDEMLAIAEQIQGWRDKKEAEEAQWKYSMWLNSEERE
jgi:hypothetical protein